MNDRTARELMRAMDANTFAINRLRLVQEMAIPKRWTLQQAADYLGVSKSGAIRLLVEHGYLAEDRSDQRGKNLRIDRDDVLAVAAILERAGARRQIERIQRDIRKERSA